MKIIVFAVSLLIAGLGAQGIIAPEKWRSLASRFDNSPGLYAAATFRVLFGLALLYAGPDTIAPLFFRILGIFTVSAGLVLFFIGLERFHRIMNWWSAQHPAFYRGFAIFALLLGIFLAYAVMV